MRSGSGRDSQSALDTRLQSPLPYSRRAKGARHTAHPRGASGLESPLGLGIGSQGPRPPRKCDVLMRLSRRTTLSLGPPRSALPCSLLVTQEPAPTAHPPRLSPCAGCSVLGSGRCWHLSCHEGTVGRQCFSLATRLLSHRDTAPPLEPQVFRIGAAALSLRSVPIPYHTHTVRPLPPHFSQDGRGPQGRPIEDKDIGLSPAPQHLSRLSPVAALV